LMMAFWWQDGTFHLFFFWQHWDLNSGPAPWANLPAPFCDGFFEIGSYELFAWADLKSQSSSSLPPE
jgi:hypothetical protein